MKIKITTSCSGLTFSFYEGQTVDVDKKIGEDLGQCGFAEEEGTQKQQEGTLNLKQCNPKRRNKKMLTIEEVKQYLHLDSDAEGDYLRILILLAGEMCENYTRLAMPDELPESYKQAMLVCIGYFFEQRDGTKNGVPSIFYTLLRPYRKVAF